MKYKVRYWGRDLAFITGYKVGEMIDEDQVMELIRAARVNVMILHVNGCGICNMDDKYFQTR